jgi:hypothetical protein
MVKPVPVLELTVGQAEKAIIKAYTVDSKILVPGRERVIVTLMRPRTTRVLVVRQDTPGSGGGNTEIGLGYSRGMLGGGPSISSTRHGNGMAVDLPAYQNDVLTALTLTGGLPGFDAKNEVVIQRNASPTSSAAGAAAGDMSGDSANQTELERSGEKVRIPLRLPRGQQPKIRPDDILLHEGDIVYIEARDAEVFYTGGYLPSGEHVLPRDYDLDVVKAIAAIGGPIVNGGQNANNLSGSLVATGLGSYSPKLVSVLRKTPCGGQVTIIVDLDRALQNPCNSLLIKPGDVVILQNTKAQAAGNYLTHVFTFGLDGVFIHTQDLTGASRVTLP